MILSELSLSELPISMSSSSSFKIWVLWVLSLKCKTSRHYWKFGHWTDATASGSYGWNRQHKRSRLMGSSSWIFAFVIIYRFRTFFIYSSKTQYSKHIKNMGQNTRGGRRGFSLFFHKLALTVWALNLCQIYSLYLIYFFCFQCVTWLFTLLK